MLAVHATLAGAWLSRNRPHIVGMLPVLWCTSTRYFGKRKGHRRGTWYGACTAGEYGRTQVLLSHSMYTAVQYSSVHSHVCVYTHTAVYTRSWLQLYLNLLVQL